MQCSIPWQGHVDGRLEGVFSQIRQKPRHQTSPAPRGLNIGDEPQKKFKS